MLQKRANRLQQKAEQEGVFKGPFLDFIIKIFSGFLCPSPPAPTPNPVPNPTPVQQTAWEKADKAKYYAEEAFKGEKDGKSVYTGKAFQKGCKDLRQEKRENGEPIKLKEAKELVRIAFDDVRASPLEEVYTDVLESEVR